MGVGLKRGNSLSVDKRSLAQRPVTAAAAADAAAAARCHRAAMHGSESDVIRRLAPGTRATASVAELSARELARQVRHHAHAPAPDAPAVG